MYLANFGGAAKEDLDLVSFRMSSSSQLQNAVSPTRRLQARGSGRLTLTGLLVLMRMALMGVSV